MPAKEISSIGIFKGFDFNNDGTEDIIIVERGGEQVEGTDKDGKKFEGYLDYLEFKPYIGSRTNFFSPFDAQDKCKLEGGIAWLYHRPEPFFYDKTGTRFFSAGQNVWVNGKIDEIEGFRVVVNKDPAVVQAGNAEIVLKNCLTTDFANISWATPTGERLDYSVITALANGVGDSSKATVAEKEVATIFAEIKKQYNGDLKVAATLLETKISPEIRKDWRLLALLKEGLKRSL